MKKKLLIFSYDFPPSNGGIARLCYEIALGISVNYKSVVILTRKKTGPCIPYNRGDISIVELPNKRLECELTAIKFLRNLKDKDQYQVLCGLWHPEALLCVLGGFRNVNILGHGAELLPGNSLFRKLFWLPIYARWILNKCQIIANSKFTGELFSNLTSKSNVFTLPLAVNHHFFKPLQIQKPAKLVLGTVSRIEQFKGHDFILRVIHQLPDEVKKSIEWHIAGTGPFLNQLKEDVDRLKLNKIVKFHGFVSDELLPDFYNSLGVFVLCTRQTKDSNNVEGFGLVFLEAQACGVPVIGTNTGGISSAVIPNDGGWLIQQDNCKELHDLIIYLYRNPAEILKQGLSARSRVENEATWEIYCNKLGKILD